MNNRALQLTYIVLRYLGIDDGTHGNTKTEEKRVDNTWLVIRDCLDHFWKHGQLTITNSYSACSDVSGSQL